MGAGKTTIGRQLARRLVRKFYDSDHEVEARTGVTVPTIFEIEGEQGFRIRESQVIAAITQERNLVVATGGGAILDPETRKRLKQTGWVVYLNVPPILLFERTRHDRNRPLLQTPDPLGKLEALHAQRDPLYREIADVVIDGSRMVAAGVVTQLIREFTQECEH